ncbi:hypothetical protein [Gilliamella apis]|uniref:hypothetical protein n=1 Tax=Gilliamella apis TaxID=1970738 RepID=UPI000A355616|nr:hypothetical protein [Gilliamella apis]OTQ34017.1 hypothetical protein B6C84_11390 [Gilliamella apis]OTQ38254.1 hypothetical protein B6D26_11390 [Gilliamella apis]OTQ38611.1 hypothetical protein B6C88_00395 [Gilliamella apis]OTQ43117.1 hypothetical protein B6C94_04970 [Gilliamella apis]OTQ44940.1 hypothetical protein B6C86_08965 [Gilliamella apis]
MNKIVTFIFIIFLNFTLTGCGEKNTITFDFAKMKVEVSDFDSNIDLPRNIENLSYSGLLYRVLENCDKNDNEQIKKEMMSGKDYTTSVCSDGIIYRFINVSKYHQ